MASRARTRNRKTQRKQKYNNTRKRGGYVWNTKSKISSKKMKTSSKSSSKPTKSVYSIFPSVIN